MVKEGDPTRASVPACYGPDLGVTLLDTRGEGYVVEETRTVVPSGGAPWWLQESTKTIIRL